MSRMKVAHVTTVDMTLRYGLLNQMLSIQQAGYEVVGISTPGPNVSALEAEGLRHIPVRMTRNLTPFADLASVCHLYRVMRRERFTIVHTHNPKPGLLGQIAARLAGVPIVINTLHGYYFHDHMRSFWRRFYITTERIAALCSDVILSQNSEDIQTARRERICQSEKMKYLGNGIDIRRFSRARLDASVIARTRRELGIAEEAPVIGFVGRLVAEKGVLDLLEAGRIVLRQIPNVRFLFVGPYDDEKSDALKPDVAQDYGLMPACIFTGRRDDMPALYAQMNVFVLPSYREGFPRSPMEASAMGVPCIVTNIRGCREAVIHNRNGLLVPLADAPALANAIIDILTSKDKAFSLGAEGRRLAEEGFDEQLMFATIKAEYARLLQVKGIAGPTTEQASFTSWR